MDSATVQVPATTANLGPGYDCLGVALQIYNRVTVRKGEKRKAKGESGMADEAAAHFFTAAAVEPFAFDFEITGDVPRSRGLGSSVTVRLGLLHGLNELSNCPLSGEQLFKICAQLEGHPDNAAPAAFGGFTIAGGKEVGRFAVAPELYFVLLIPGFEIATPEARRVLPAQLDRLAAVASCANACRITAAFAAQNYEQLRGAFADGLHQPFREKELIPFLSAVIAAGEQAGALGGFLSGSGSTVCCVVEERAKGEGRKAKEIADAMLSAARTPHAQIIIAAADNVGIRIVGSTGNGRE